MSSDSHEPPPAPRPARPVNRWGVGAVSVIQVVLLVALLVALNYLSSSHYQRADLSRDGAYTLSPATAGWLGSGAIAERERPVKWVVAYRRGPGASPFYERVRALSEEYARLSAGKIEVEIVDPLRSPDRTREVMETYGLNFVRDMVIIDARADDTPVTTSDAEGVRTLNPNVKIVAGEDLVLHEMVATGGQGIRQRQPTAFQGEDVLTARLVEAVEGRPRKMYFIADKSRIDAKGGDQSPAATLQSTLRFQNIELTGIGIAGLAEIPADAEGVAVVAPRYDFSEDEIAVLERYWTRPKAALLLLLGGGETPPNLRAFLRKNGISPQNDRVVTVADGQAITTVRANFSRGVDFLDDLAGQATVFEGASASLAVRDATDEDLMNRRIIPLGLIEIAPGYWGETRFGQGEVALDPDDHTGTLHLAAGAIRGAASDDRFAAETSRMIVVSNIDFLDPANQRAENLDFLASSVNWLVGRESLAGIGPRSLGTYKLPILDAQVSFINRVNLFFLPAFLLVIGGFVWSSRRA